MEVLAHNLWDRIEATLEERIAAEDALGGDVRATQRTVDTQCLNGVLTALMMEATHGRQQG